MPVMDYCRRDPFTVERDVSARKAAVLMQEKGVGSLVVVERGAFPVGMITDRDIALEVLGRQLDPDAVAVGELMCPTLVSIEAGATLREAARTLRIHALRRLPVVDETGKLVGILSLDDLLGLLTRELEGVASAAVAHPPHAAISIEQIRREAEIERTE